MDFEAFLALKNIDFGTFHLYTADWNHDVKWGTQYIKVCEKKKPEEKKKKEIMNNDISWMINFSFFNNDIGSYCCSTENW